MTVIQRIGGRRFLVVVGCGAVTSLLQAFGKLDPAGSTYALVIIGTVGAYITGDTLEARAAHRAQAAGAPA